MRILTSVLGLALLAGCASMEEKRADGAAYSFKTEQAPERVAECVLYGWQNQPLSGVHYDISLQPLRGGGKTVVSAGQVEFADFKPLSRGTAVELYFQSGLMDWRKKKRTEVVEKCL